MDVKDLRVRNYVKVGNYIWGVYLIRGIPNEKKVTVSKTKTTIPVDYKVNDIKPIPLTEGWLLRLGFNRHSSNKFWFRKKQLCISLLGAVELISWDMQIFKIDTKISNVHQLQNLYFALTGEELTLKQ